MCQMCSDDMGPDYDFVCRFVDWEESEWPTARGNYSRSIVQEIIDWPEVELVPAEFSNDTYFSSDMASWPKPEPVHAIGSLPGWLERIMKKDKAGVH